MIGAPVSGLLLLLDGAAGLQGWQWLFVVEGVPAILLGFLAPRLLTDRPRDAHWLADDERAWLVDATEAEARAKEAQGDHRFVAGLKDRRALAFSALYFGLVIGIYGLSFWLPTTVEALGDFGTVTASLVTAIPYAVAAVFTFLWSRSSDRRRERVGHVAIAELLAAVGLLASGYLLDASPVLAIAALSLAAMGIYGSIGPFLEMPSAALAGAAAASGLALVNSIGNLGGFVAPYVVGALRDATGSSQAGLLFLAAVLALTALATYLYGRRTGAGLPPADLPSTPTVRAQEGA
jgi:ACS family tartrate transporter-like MFS transporter